MLQRQLLVQGCLLVLCALLSVASIAETEYYTWVDDNGVTNYAQRKPADHNASYVGSANQVFGRPQQNRRPQGSQAASKSEDKANNPEVSVEAERAAVAQKIASARKSNCEIGKRNLAQLEAFSRIRVKGPDGKEKILSAQEKAAQITEAKAIIQKNCTG